MSLYTYDPKKILCIVGVAPMQGFAEDTAIELELDDDVYATKAGIDGDVSRARVHGLIQTAKITLMQTSPSNDVLSAIHALDLASNAGVVPFMLKDVLGTTLIFSGYCWIRKPAPVAFGKEVGNRVWTLTIANVTQFIGGNAKVLG